MDKKIPANIDEYIAAFPQDIQERLQALRQTIQQAAPQAEEIISYGMPAFRLKINLVYFAAAKKHIGFYGMPSSVIEAFKEPLATSAVVNEKGTIQFAHNRPLPLELVAEMVKCRLEQILKA